MLRASPRGKRTRSPSMSAPASLNSCSASGVSRNSIPTCSSTVSAFSSISDRCSSDSTSNGFSVARDVRHADRVRDGARGLPGGAAAAATAAGRLGHAGLLCGARTGSAPRRRRRPSDASATRRGGRVTVARSRAYGSVSCGIAIAPTKSSWKRGSTAVSIFSTRRTTSSISARARAVEQRDARAGAGGVAGRRDVGRVAVGHEAEHERVHRVDVVAERAGEPDPVDVVDPVALAEQHAARVERRLGELDLADVVLGDRQQRLAVGEDVGEGAAVGDDPGRACRERAVDRAVGREHAGEVELGDHLDDPRAADAGHVRAGEARLVRPDLAADHPEAGLERLRVDPHALDRARRGALAAADLRPLERRPGRARRGEQPVAVAEHDLGVRADVDDQVDLVAEIRRLGEDHAGRIGADVARRCRAARRRARRDSPGCRGRAAGRRTASSIVSANGAPPSSVGSRPSRR